MLALYITLVSLLTVSLTEGSDCEICDLKEDLANTKSELSECESKLNSNTYINQVCSRVGSWMGPKQDPALKTTVQKLLKHLNLDSIPLNPDGPPSQEKELTLKMSNSDLVTLRRFILNDEGTDEAVQDILIKSLIPKENNGLDISQLLTTFLPTVDAMSPHVRPGLVVSVIVGVVGMLGLVMYKGGARGVFKVVLFIMFLSVTMTWANMYMKAAAKKQATLARLGNVPKACLLEKQGWKSASVDFVRGLFNRKVDPCEEYYAAAMVDPLWEVSILDAITETVCQLVIRPCSTMGIILGNFYSNIIDPIPFAWKIPVMVIATILLLFLMLLCCGYEISIPFILKIAPQKKQVIRLNSEREQLTSDCRNGRSLSGSRYPSIEETDTEESGVLRSRSQEPLYTSQESSEGLRQRSLPYPSTCTMPGMPSSPGAACLDQSQDGSFSFSPGNRSGGGFRYPLNPY